MYFSAAFWLAFDEWSSEVSAIFFSPASRLSLISLGSSSSLATSSLLMMLDLPEPEFD